MPNTFNNGTFTVNATGRVQFDYLLDGGKYQGELAVFSLTGLENYTPGSTQFITEVARRALSNTDRGRILISDRNEGARFSSSFAWENNFNSGTYGGVNSFELKAGDKVGFVLLQDTTFQDIYLHPNEIGKSGKLPIFSIPEANLNNSTFNQLVAVNNRGTFAFEDRLINSGLSDKDYNDLVFQAYGLEGNNVAGIDGNVNPNRDWRNTATGQQLQTYTNRPIFNEGVFEVGETGQLTIDYLYDGGGYGNGELAVFNLAGMETYTPGSQAFIKEAARRALSNSNSGYVLIKDQTEGAKFSYKVPWENNFGAGTYAGVKSFQFNPGDKFGILLTQNTSVQSIFNTPSITTQSGKRALFSIKEANPGGIAQGQFVDVNGTSTYALEDLSLARDNADRDYNDIIFQIKGARGTLASLDTFVNPSRDWRNYKVSQDLIDYSNRAAFDEGVFVVGQSGQVTIDFLYDGGAYANGEVGIFSLSGMDIYRAGSKAFAEEAVRRATSNSAQGHIVVQDANEGARFSSNFAWESNYNNGQHQGRQTFQMTAGDAFGLVLIPDSTLQDSLTAPDWATKRQPLFSISDANINHNIQIADILTNNQGTIVGFEDLRLDRGSNYDYNDIILAIEGAQKVGLTDIEDLSAHNRNWLGSNVGADILDYFNDF
jgi:hypothetical protein